MTNLKTKALVAVLGGAVLMAGAAGAASAPGPKCASSKRKAVGKLASSLLGCHAKAASKGETLDTECVDKANGKFSSAFAKAEAKGGCATDGNAFGGDEPGLIAGADAYADEVAAALRPNMAANKCQSSKLKAAGKETASLFGCHAKAISKGEAVDPACLQKARDKQTSAFGKAEAKPPCDTTGDGGSAQAIAETYVDTTVPRIPGSDGCGNSLTVAPETCDDGNAENNDACPADCIIDDCSPLGGTDRQVSVNFTGTNVAGVTILLDYPEGKVSIPGSGASVPAGIITDNPGGSFASANDLDHALRELVASDVAMTSGLIFRVHFEDCSGALAPVAGDFTCTVVAASDPNAEAVEGVTCSVTVP